MLFTFLYNLTIRPIEYLISTVYYLMYCFFQNEGFAIISVSLLISTLVLPLYLWADGIQEEEKKQQEEMKPWLEHIRRTFKGDERMLMQTTYYRERGYRPVYALRGLLPLFLQIPFFMAAYHYLSSLTPISTISFGPIRDLMQEDGLIALGDLRLNLLPILMTAINILSSCIYNQGEGSLSAKLQPLILALIFLVLLYRSPAGLVLYWTMNNLYSLIKNLVMKCIRRPERFGAGLLITVALLLPVLFVVTGRLGKLLYFKDYEMLALFCAIYLLVLAGVVYGVCKAFDLRLPGKIFQHKESAETEYTRSTTLILAACLSMLIGGMIPGLVISASPVEFLDADQGLSPLRYIGTSLTVAAGLFLFWGTILECLLSVRQKRVYQGLLFVTLVGALVNFMCFAGERDTISTLLVYNMFPVYSKLTRRVNVLVLLAIFIIGFLLFRYAKRLFRTIPVVILVSLTVMTLRYGIQIVTETRGAETVTQGEVSPLNFSKNGKNVIVIMLDRAIGGYVPFIFDEKPELLEKFDGFTFYPNTSSFGLYTNFGLPAVFGGYDYTPEEMNRRDDLLLGEKHDEALRLMPTLFSEEGYHVYASDFPYIHYGLSEEQKTVPILEGLEGTEYHELRSELPQAFDPQLFIPTRERNFIFYSLMKIMPAFLQNKMYDQGYYLSYNRVEQRGGPRFLKDYSVLDQLPDITETAEDTKGLLFMMCNDTAHEPAILSLPDYSLGDENNGTSEAASGENYSVDFSGPREVGGRTIRFDMDNVEYSVGHYHSFMAAFLMLGKWFDQLKELGVYDNTRIILVADHGRDLEQFDHMLLDNGIDAESVNCLLMVKDFDSHGFTMDESFMTNADTPYLAMEGLLQEPLINPYTGNTISMEGKNGGINIIWSKVFNVNENCGYVYEPQDSKWYHVQDNLFDSSCWSEIDGL